MPDTDRRPYVGRALKRIEDPKLVTGQGQYVDDLKIPGLAALAFLRSPHAHARVIAIRTDAAQKAPGVIRVVTAADLPPLRPTPFMAVVPGLKASPYRCLAGDVVDSTGVPVAAVVAESPSQAREALDLIEVEYEPLPAVADPERALAPRAPLVHPARPSRAPRTSCACVSSTTVSPARRWSRAAWWRTTTPGRATSPSGPRRRTRS